MFRLSKLRFVEYKGPESIQKGKIPRVYMNCPENLVEGICNIYYNDVIKIAQKDSNVYVTYLKPEARLSIQELEVLIACKTRDSVIKGYYYDREVIEKLDPLYDIITNKLNDLATMVAYRRSFIRSIERFGTSRENVEKKFEFLKNLSKSGNGFKPTIEFTFHNVTAEDVLCDKPDIYLGDLTYSVNVITNDVRLISGDYCRDGYSSNSYHPHQISSSGEICLGTQNADFVEALGRGDFDIAEGILFKFSHSYKSDDGAGRYYYLWLDEEENPVVYVPSRGEHYPESVCTMLNDEYYHSDDIVYSDYNDSELYRGDAVWSEHHGTYILEEDSFIYNGDNYHTDIMVTTAEGVEVPDFLEGEVFMDIDGEYYLEENVVEDYQGEQRLKDECHYNDILDIYIYKEEDSEDIVFYEDTYYPLSLLPEEILTEIGL